MFKRIALLCISSLLVVSITWAYSDSTGLQRTSGGTSFTYCEGVLNGSITEGSSDYDHYSASATTSCDYDGALLVELTMEYSDYSGYRTASDASYTDEWDGEFSVNANVSGSGVAVHSASANHQFSDFYYGSWSGGTTIFP